MGRNPIETIMGAVVLIVAAFFLVFAYNTADLKPVTGYPVSAVFLRVGGLENGSDVRVNGVKVGSVVGQSLDTTTYEAVVDLTISPDIQIPEDSRAAIVSDGLLGGKYVRLEPGESDVKLAAGDRLTRTQDFQSLEDLVGEIIFLATQPAPPGS
jgi:phospholipid/cholesterol/gamma-HCH transport system substrate-binding protein